MRILYCGPKTNATYAYLNASEAIAQTEQCVKSAAADLIISHGYRHILSPAVLATTRVVNLHISYLPWNRGAHPNFWAIYEGTPSGVTVHWVDEGVDTGPIIAQRRVEPRPDDTLASSYSRLQAEMTKLFIEYWPAIKDGIPGRPQTAPAGYTPGSYHRSADLPDLPNGWSTPIAKVAGSGLDGVRRLIACR